MNSWITRSKKTLLTFGKFLAVEQHVIELPDGQIIDDWPWLIGPDFINVLAVTEDGHFLVFRQGKYGLEGESLAPVGGYIEPGEDPLAAARRELMEETGYEADMWTSLGQYRVDPNRGVGTGYFYLARQARCVKPPSADDLEEQELLQLTRQEVSEAVLTGQIKSMAWIANVALALIYLDREASG
jgi:ADP-ribose pyrophosphatase